MLYYKMDPGELFQFKQAERFSRDLADKWLNQYLLTHNSANSKERQKLASNIAESLNDHERWRFQGRGINMDTLLAS